MDGSSPSVFRSECWINSAGYDPSERKKNYDCDITYATNSELGFDYLRDNMAADMSEVVQRDFQFCVIDEVDSILIDEARTPLIISGQVDRPIDKYTKAAFVASELTRSPNLVKTELILMATTKLTKAT